MRHTPGPWNLSDTFRVYGPERRHPQSTELGVEMTTNTTVAWVACPNYEEQKANARIIVAGPDLLETVRVLLQLVPRFPIGSQSAKQVDEACQLVARVEGGV